MTENPTLTEDEILIRGSMAVSYLKIIKQTNFNEALELKQQILTALEQYPKLQQEINQLKQLKQRIEKYITTLDGYPNRKAELQQLLKDDKK